MKVLHLCPSYNNILYRNLINEEIAIGIECDVYYFHGKKEIVDFTVDKNVINAPVYNEFDRFFFHKKERKIYNYLSSKKKVGEYDIIHAHTLFTSGYIAYQIFCKYKTPYIVAIRNTDINIFFKYRFNLRQLGIEILKNAQNIVFISENAHKELYSKYIIEDIVKLLEKKTVVIPNGIEDIWFGNNLEKHKNTDSQTINLLYYGDITKNKNLINVCKAIQIIENEGYCVNYRVIGPVKDHQVYKKVLKYGFVHFQEKSPKEVIKKALLISDVFVMPSFSETFGLSYVESISCDVPVVFTNGQGIDGFFSDNFVGCGVDPNSITSIKNGIVFAYKNRHLLESRGQELVKQFNWPTIAKNYLNLYGGEKDVIPSTNETDA